MWGMLLRRVVGLFGWLVVALFLSSCSLRKVGYDLAGRIVTSRVVDTFDLSGQDKATAERFVRELHKWHRHEELPRYVQLIDGLIERLRDGMSEDDWDGWKALTELVGSKCQLVGDDLVLDGLGVHRSTQLKIRESVPPPWFSSDHQFQRISGFPRWALRKTYLMQMFLIQQFRRSADMRLR